MTPSASWPEPPVWRTNFSRTFSAGFETVSRYATWGRPTLASTRNSRSSRSTMISRWSPPMPAMIVWPVSSSDETRNVGSSSASRCRAAASLSWSPFVFGSIATQMTGAGEVLRADLLALLAVVGVHLEDAADPLSLAGRRVQHPAAGLERARVDTEVGQL